MKNIFLVLILSSVSYLAFGQKSEPDSFFTDTVIASYKNFRADPEGSLGFRKVGASQLRHFKGVSKEILVKVLGEPNDKISDGDSSLIYVYVIGFGPVKKEGNGMRSMKKYSLKFNVAANRVHGNPTSSAQSYTLKK